MENYRSKHVFDHVRHFLNEIGCEDSKTGDLKIEIELKKIDYRGLAPLIASFEGETYGVILPGCSYEPSIKIWPQEHYAEVIRLLGNTGPRCWLISGADNELQACHDVAQSLENNCADVRTAIFCGPPLSRLAAALKGATIAMGCDNGGMHLAVALDTPTVTIVSGALGELYFPWGNPEKHRVASHAMDCWGCYFNCVHELPFCIRNITPLQVAANCKAVLSCPVLR
jgi:ADP-heptose:LPS heptosyltransferase